MLWLAWAAVLPICAFPHKVENDRHEPPHPTIS
jgi:hypothetical protein